MVCLNLLPVAFEKSYRLRQASCFIIKERNLCKKADFTNVHRDLNLSYF